MALDIFSVTKDHTSGVKMGCFPLNFLQVQFVRSLEKKNAEFVINVNGFRMTVLYFFEVQVTVIFGSYTWCELMIKSILIIPIYSTVVRPYSVKMYYVFLLECYFSPVSLYSMFTSYPLLQTTNFILAS